MWRLIAVLITLFCSQIATATEIPFLTGVLEGFAELHAECPPLIQAPSELSLNELGSLFESRVSEEAHCGAALVADELTRRDPEGRIRWIVSAVDQLAAAGDYRKSVTYGLQAIAGDSALAAEKPLRLSLLKSVYGAIEALGNDKDPLWMEWALGIRDRLNPLAAYLRIRSYAVDFPGSEELPELKKMEARVGEMYVSREIEIARLYVVRSRYMAAITRLEALYRYPIFQQSAFLPRVLLNVAEIEREFADVIDRNSWFSSWTDERLRDVFRIPYDRKVDRAALAGTLRLKASQAEALARKMTRKTS